MASKTLGEGLEMAISTATGQRCLWCERTYPLYPPLVAGCPACETDEFKSPLEVIYDYPDGTEWLPCSPSSGLCGYMPVMPPLAEWLSLGEGGTPLIGQPSGGWDPGVDFYIKDESRNPTWSHKDRLNFVVMSAALALGAPGVVVASSGNHGASAAAYSARAGLDCIVLCTPRPPAVASFLQAYGRLVLAVPDIATRSTLMRFLVDELGFHPASNLTIPPTNHPFGSEGYKSIAYELYLQLDRRAPSAVFVPVGYAELLFGIFKGFDELRRYGLIKTVPRMIGCEPATGAPLKRALEEGKPIVSVETAPSDAYSIHVSMNSYRGVVAIRGSGGAVLAISDEEMRMAQAALSRIGLWSELSAAIAFAGVMHATDLGLADHGPVVCVNTSSGFKDIHVGENPVLEIDGTFQALQAELRRWGYV